jgi:thymidylate synthase (FAD)
VVDGEVRLYNYGPRAVVDVSGRSLEVGPDVFIAVEGVGTFEGVSLERRLEKLLMKGKDAYDSLNPLIAVATLEPVSLVAYHQSIRHRTVPTSVEPIYAAVGRAVKDMEAKNIVMPPFIRGNEGLRSMFMDVAGEAFQTYQSLVEDGIRPSDALYILPQALRLYMARLYNGFHFLHPSGYVAMRTCSYAEWEQRGIAYKIMYEFTRRVPSPAHLGEKCRHLGFCPKREWCPIILKYHPYDDERHKAFSG